MNMILPKIAESGLVAIIRGIDKNYLLSAVDALMEGGCNTVEITCDTPSAIEMINTLKENFKNELIIGAGTVLDRQTARLAILAGAQFVLMPHLSVDVIEICNLYGKDVVPGVMTPTEITQALQLGCKMVKIFPASILGARYFTNILKPIAQIQMMAVGGINISNAADYLRAGAVALGVGKSLINKEILERGEYSEIIAKTREYLRIICEVKGNIAR